jgi:ribosomal protein S18 acetylase RimI-like enzyme
MASTDPWITLARDYAQCLARLTRPEYILLLAHRGEERLGFVQLHPTGFVGSPYIVTLATGAEHRSQGIGSALLRESERQFPDAMHIFLCVTSFNRRARELYERHGYQQVGELPDYVIPGVSEIMIHKRLGQ